MASLSKEAKLSTYPKGFKHGVNIKGLPVNVVHPGEVFWVDENAKSPSNNKGTFVNPATSIELCMDLCVADRGDVIMVKPGHIENISGVAALTFDVAGVAVVGCGVGAKQAKMLWDAAAGIADIEADNITIANMWMVPGYADVATGFNLDADHCTFEGNRVSSADAALDFTAFIQIADNADHFSFHRNDVRLFTASNTNAIVALTGESVAMNVFGNFIVAPGVTALFDLDAGAITGYPVFRDNVMVNIATDTGLCVAINSATVATFANERYGTNKTNTVPMADISASFSMNCQGVDIDDAFSTDMPQTACA